MKVLVVDDNQKFRELLRDYLPESVDEIYECADGSQALALYNEHHPEWVLMDWQMPEKDGITATREIIAKYPDAKICLVTSYDDEVLRNESIEAGAIKFVLKRNLFELPEILISESR
jgi:two-component system, NarL family, response regulator DegU